MKYKIIFSCDCQKTIDVFYSMFYTNFIDAYTLMHSHKPSHRLDKKKTLIHYIRCELYIQSTLR